MANWRDQLVSVVDEIYPQMVALRRHLHAHPEVSGREFETSMYLYQDLGDRGYSVQLGPEGRGVIAEYPETSGPGKAPAAPHPLGGRLALRADIDALMIQDEKVAPYRSTYPGVMHACGHDAHTATVYGAMLAIDRLCREDSDAPRPHMRFVFQPAEETAEGAAAMIEAGVLNGVDAILACHMDPTRQVGRVGLRADVLTASCDDMHIRIQGFSGHAARPHEARDPISAAAQLINLLYLQIPRVTDSQEAVVVSIGKIIGGTSNNVIPDLVEMYGTVRTLNQKVRERTHDHIQRIAQALADGMGVDISVSFGSGCYPVVNDPYLIELIHDACSQVLFPDSAERIPRPSMGSEDFAFYGEHVPAALFRLGCRSEKTGGSLLHTPLFDIDEEALRVGARVFVHTSLSWLEKRQRAAQ
ncbi:MAG: amidohydrolase [Planctomycetales bacterium]|nr:amidohydrolase [Planctomycetales bacterium]